MVKYPDIPNQIPRLINNYIKKSNHSQKELIDKINELQGDLNLITVQGDGKSQTLKSWRKGVRPKNLQTRKALFEALCVSPMETIFRNGIEVQNYLIHLLDWTQTILIRIYNEIDQDENSLLTTSSIEYFLSNNNAGQISDLVTTVLKLDELFLAANIHYTHSLPRISPLILLKLNEQLDNGIFIHEKSKNSEQYALVTKRDIIPEIYNEHLSDSKLMNNTATDRLVLKSLMDFLQALKQYVYNLFKEANTIKKNDPNNFFLVDYHIYCALAQRVNNNIRIKNEKEVIFNNGMVILTEIFKILIQIMQEGIDTFKDPNKFRVRLY